MWTLYQHCKSLKHLKLYYFAKGLSEVMLASLKFFKIPITGISLLTNKSNTISWNSTLGDKVLGKFINTN